MLLIEGTGAALCSWLDSLTTKHLITKRERGDKTREKEEEKTQRERERERG